MRTLPVRWIRFNILSLLLLWASMADSLFAQELMFSGVGPINHSLAGTAVGLPRDSAGAMQWNPATLSFLEHEKFEFQLGWGRHNAPWYGDEPIAYTALLIPWFILQGLLNPSSNEPTKNWQATAYGDEYWTSYDKKDSDSSSFLPYPKDTTPVIRVPTFSYVYNFDRHLSFGLAVSEYGAEKNGFFFDVDKETVGIYQYPFRGYEFIPTVAYRASQRFSLGFSPIFSIDEMPNATLPLIPFSRYSGVQDRRSQAGFGAQVGVYYTPNQRLRFGASVRTPQLISRYTYRWIDPITGELGTQRLSFSQDSAFRIALGTSYTLRNDKTTVAADFRYSDYSHASALYDIPASFDPAVKKQGISRAVYTMALGAEHRPMDFVAFRMGYQWNHAVTPERAIIYNTGLPIQSGHSIHYGVTFFLNPAFDLSFSSSNSFGGGWETLHTDEGSIRFRSNPNRSNFWASARLRF
jgi:long-chain fatty acid transport protein